MTRPPVVLCWIQFGRVKAGDVLLLAYDVMSEGAYINIYIFVVFKEGACVQHQLRSILDFVWSNLSVYSPEVVVLFSRVKLFATHLDLEIILILYALYIIFAFFMRCIYIYIYMYNN